MFRTTAGQLAIEGALPQQLRQTGREWDKKNTTAVLQRLAEEHPDQYRETLNKLIQLGRRYSYETGGNSFGVSDLAPAEATAAARQRIEAARRPILTDPNLSRHDKLKQPQDTGRDETSKLTGALFQEAKDKKNPLALQIMSGAKGNERNLQSLLGFDGFYEDSDGNTIPLPVLRNYAQGLSAGEYFAGAFGARRGVIDVKKSTADAGYLGKQLTQVAHRLLVSGLDDEKDPDNKSRRGLPVSANDPDSVGALLAVDHGPFPRNTVITPKILAALRASGNDELLVRSPTVGGPNDHGVYARDVGWREKNRLAPYGDYVGIAAAQALTEKLVQGQLCLARGTLVRMADGSTKKIEEIQIGDQVLGADKAGHTFPVRVLRTFDNGERKCHAFQFRRPFSKEVVATLVSTPDHKILSLRQYWGQKAESDNHVPKIRPVGTATPKDRFSAVRQAGFTCDDRFQSHPFARLLGVWLGDGIRVLPDTGVMVSCFDPTLAASISEHIQPLGLNFTKMKGHPGQYFVGQMEDVAERNATGQFCEGYRNPLKALIAEWDMLGKYAHEKTLPACVSTWTNESVAELLSGLWVTDGSVFVGSLKSQKPYLSYGSTSLVLLQQIKELLAWRFGIHAVGPYSHIGARKRTMYKIDITTELDVKRFREVIKLHGVKKETFDAILQVWQIARPRSGRYGLIRCTEDDVGSLPTHDIEVDHPDHLFVLANGLIVSNSSKHTGGIAGVGPTGFTAINQILQTPESYPGGASHAQDDGKITAIRPAPQGGQFVDINGTEHYLDAGLTPKVKTGDHVEAGDVLSDGLPNPAEIVKHKGIGEGRRYFTQLFTDIYNRSGFGGHRRNIELLSRGLLNHVRMNGLWGNYAPDDVVPYTTIESNWEPRAGYQTRAPKDSVGGYLERPALHYSIGTKIRKSMLPQFDRWGVKTLDTHAEPPPFEPEMQRAATAISTDEDWMPRMLGSGQQSSLLDAVHRGSSSDIAGTSYVPALAEGTSFGKVGPTKGWSTKPQT